MFVYLGHAKIVCPSICFVERASEKESDSLCEVEEEMKIFMVVIPMWFLFLNPDLTDEIINHVVIFNEFL